MILYMSSLKTKDNFIQYIFIQYYWTTKWTFSKVVLWPIIFTANYEETRFLME